MANIKYSEDTCSDIISNLEKVSLALADVESALSTYISSQPSDYKIDRRVDKLSEEEDPETGEKYTDRSKYNYYNWQCASPLKNARDNLSSIKGGVSSLKSEIESVKGNLSQVSALVGDYEDSSTEIEGLDNANAALPTLSPEYTTETVYDKHEVGDDNAGKGFNVNIDLNGDGIPDLNIDNNGDGIPDVNIDINGDGKPDLNIDNDGDGIPDTNIDINGDGKPDINIDNNGDGIPDVNIDINGDGKPDINIDTNGDGSPDVNVDINGDGKPDVNIDTDGDGIPDTNVDINGDGKPDINIDTNGDGVPDTNVDINGDGTPDINIDTNGDGVPDVNIDTDGDGVPDTNIDTDGDGIPDSKIDANGNGIPDEEEKEKPDGTDGKETIVDIEKDPDDEDENDPNTELSPKGDDGSDIFDPNNPNGNTGGFADNIDGTGNGTGDGKGDGTGDGVGTNGTGGTGGGIWAGAGGNSSGVGGSGSEGEEGLFPFLPGKDSTSSDGENPDFIYRGLYDQSDEAVDVGSIDYQAMSEGAAGAAKGAAVAAGVGLGVSGVDAVATLNEQRKQDGDMTLSADEKEEKKLVKTIISCSILGIMTVGFFVSVLMPNVSIIAVIFLGLAMAISAITASTGLKVGKYVGFGVLLATSLITFILGAAGVISPVGYVVVFGAFVVLSIAAYLLDLLKGMFDDKMELLPILISIAVGLLFAMLKVLDVINWIVFIILLALTVGGYFLYDKVLKYKLPDDDDDEESIPQVVYNPVRTQENTSIVPEEKGFDPRDLYKENQEENKPALGDRVVPQDQNPFADYNPMNSSFDNAFKDDKKDNNNGPFGGMF